jgi:hypothetical protein
MCVFLVVVSIYIYMCVDACFIQVQYIMYKPIYIYIYKFHNPNKCDVFQKKMFIYICTGIYTCLYIYVSIYKYKCHVIYLYR